MDSAYRSNKSFIKRNWLLAILIMVLVAIIAVLLFKTSLPAPPLPPLPPGAMPPKPERLKSITGTVVAFGSNAHRDINSIKIQSQETGLINIDFLPHTAGTVMMLAAIGQSVKLIYSMRPDNESVGYQLEEIKNLQTGAATRLDELPPPPSIPNHSAENFNLENPTLMTDSYGGIVALKKDSMLFHFKPGLVDDIMPMMKTSHRFGLMAVRRPDNLGFINVDHDRVYIVLSVTLDNKTFLVR